MARWEDPPFGRGETFYGISPVPAIDTGNLGGLQHEGKEWWFEDLNFSIQGVKPPRTNRMVRCRCVRNSSGANLLPSFLGQFDPAYYGARISGYTNATNGRGYPIDEWLPAAGVPNNDLFWIVIEGPAMCYTPLAGADFAATAGFAVGQVVNALTAVTSGATTAGRVQCQITTMLVASTTGGSSVSNDFVSIKQGAENYIGRALSAMTSGQTNAPVLIEVGHW